MEAIANKQFSLLLRIIIAVMILGVAIVTSLLIRSIFLSRQDVAPRTAIERALLDARAAVEADAKSASARLELGRVHAEMGRYGDAVSELNMAKKFDSKDREIPYTLAMVYKAQGDTKAATRELKTAIKLHESQYTTKFSEAHFELGLIYYEQKSYKKALSAFKKAEEGAPQAADMLLYLGLTYEKMGQKKEATGVLEYVNQLLPENKEAKEALSRLKK